MIKSGSEKCGGLVMMLLQVEDKLHEIRRNLGGNFNWGDVPAATLEFYFVWYGIIVSPETDLWGIDRKPARILLPPGHHGGGVELTTLMLNANNSVEHQGQRAYLLKLRGVSKVFPRLTVDSYEFRLKKVGLVNLGIKSTPCCEFDFDVF